jgi:hypothetical protein
MTALVTERPAWELHFACHQSKHPRPFHKPRSFMVQSLILSDNSHLSLPASISPCGPMCGLRSYEGRSQIIWPHLLYSNFINFRLDTKLMLAQQIAPPPRPPPFSCGASGWLSGTILQRCCDTTDGSRLCTVLATGQTPYQIDHGATTGALSLSPQAAVNLRYV